MQFLESLQHIQRDNPAAAARLLRRCEKALRRLQDHPDSGRTIPEFPELPHRELIVKPLRIFYRVEKRTVWIVAVWHGAQRPGPP